MTREQHSDNQTANEQALIAGLQAREQQAYRQAVRHYTPGMMAVARFYTDPAGAEEIVQDCWVTVIDAIGRFEGRSGLKTWLHRIVANRCKNRLRAGRREVLMDFSETLDPELAGRFNANGRWDTPPRLRFEETGESLMENSALSECLDKHLSGLPENQRSALMLYEAHQHKSEDVCNLLDVSAANLRVLLHRARQRILLMVESFQETGEC